MKNMIPKAIFFDIDGTLVPYGTHCVSQADCDAIEMLRSRGTLIFICTGRHITCVDNIPFAVDGAVCCNGALTYVVKAEASRIQEWDKFMLVDCHAIPRRQASCIAQIVADNRIPTVMTTLSGEMFCYRTPQTAEFIQKVNMPEFRDGDILEAARLEKVFTFCPFLTQAEEKKLFNDMMPGLGSYRWSDACFDIVVLGLDKVLGVKKILDMYRIPPEDTVAFGDGVNDIGMLKYAGMGVAMAHAEDGVKKVADCVADSVNVALRRLLE